MTVIKLHKLLGKMIEQGHGRKRVCINKATFKHPLESDGCVTLDIAKVGIQNYPLLDGDGGPKFRADGSESTCTTAVISGDYEE